VDMWRAVASRFLATNLFHRQYFVLLNTTQTKVDTRIQSQHSVDSIERAGYSPISRTLKLPILLDARPLSLVQMFVDPVKAKKSYGIPWLWRQSTYASISSACRDISSCAPAVRQAPP